MNKDVCAIIVTYNFDDSFLKCINSIKYQVKEIIIVDNKSNEKCIDILNRLSNDKNINIIFNKKNVGIAKALNIGINRALEKDYNWIITLDDDSEATENMVSNMLKTYKIINNNDIALLTPNIFDLNINETIHNNTLEYEYIGKCIQSGSMIRVDVLNKVGLFNEDLFIYYVDDEFCERVIKNKLKILRINESILNHRDGLYIKRKFLLKQFNYNDRSDLSIYYRARNNIYMTRNYNYRYIKENIKDLVKIVLYSNNKKSNLQSYLYGIRDGLKNTYGMCERVHK